jgi:DNA-binding LacI/PurR family transcriptional regulator
MTTQRSRSLGRPTLDEVAARAGVGRGTVSRVVNGSPQVSPESRAAVEQAIAELNYVPNRAARALVTQRTDSVALIVSESEARVFGEPFFAGIIRGVSAVLAETPLQLWLAMAQSPAERDRVNQHLTSQHVDGVLLLSLHDDDPLPGRLVERGLPVILGGRPARMLSGGDGISFVDVDNVGGGRLAVEHLVGGGRRLVGTIAGPQDMAVGVARLAGYREAVQQARLPFGDDLIGYGDFSEESGAAAMRKVLQRCPEIDALFAASDLMAAGAMRVLKERGRRIPSDVAVVGFEDSVIARQTVPALTTINQPVEEMGREMARLLLDRLRDGGGVGYSGGVGGVAGVAGGGMNHHNHRSVILDTHLVRRASA